MANAIFPLLTASPGKRLVLLAREPGDVLVSFYQHWQHRMKPSKHWVNDYPAGPLTVLDTIGVGKQASSVVKLSVRVGAWGASIFHGARICRRGASAM